MEKIELNTDTLSDMSGKVTEQSLKSKLPQLNAEAYRGKHVVVKGCAPTWAVMKLQHQLEGVAGGLSFKLFDGKEIAVW
ncbi:MAG: hypothetical protein ACREL1_02005 [bacterium]